MKINDTQKGVLYIIPSPLGDTPPLEVLPISIKTVINELTHFIVENEKMGRRFIKKIVPSKNQDELVVFQLNKYSTQEEINTYLDCCSKGISIGLLSDVGCPGIADPGAEVVEIAHQLKMKVKPLVGPSSILLALIASGKNGQNFTFNGYLPKDRGERIKMLKNLERLSRNGQTQIFMETPFRNNHLIEDVLVHCDNSLKLCIAASSTLANEKVITKTIGDWKKQHPDYHKDYCIFVL